jgi:cytochrome oxidase assembly protein ShyY1
VYGFLLRPKWLLFLVGCAAGAALCVSLGLWQLDRLEQRRALNERVLDARRAEPVDIARVFDTDRAPAVRDEFRLVKAVGKYDPGKEHLVRGRSVDRRAGVYVLTPLTLAGGDIVLVVRGWAPFSDKGAGIAPDFPSPPTGEVTVIGRARRPEDGAGGAARMGEYPAVRRIAPAELAGALSGPLFQGYVELVRQTPAGEPGLVAIPEPTVGEGPHLAYGVQWFLFGALMFVAYGIYARREAQSAEEERDPMNSSAETVAP